MIRSIFAAMLLAGIVSSTVLAQDTLPQAVRTVLNDQTILVARVDLTGFDVGMFNKFMAGIPDPTGGFGKSTAQFGPVLQGLIDLKVGQVFAVLSTSDLPDGGPTLVIPTQGSEAERAAGANSLKAVLGKDLQVVPGGVIARFSKTAIPFSEQNSQTRPEFSTAFASVKDSRIQVAISLGKDARRVLQEFGYPLPTEFGRASLGSIADGWKWLVLGVTPSPSPSVKLIIQAADVSTAEALEQFVAAALKVAMNDAGGKDIFANSSEVISLLTPTRKVDQLILSLTEVNNGANRLMNQVVTPLLAQMEKNSRRQQTRNHLKQIGLAMHNYHDAHKAFPAAATLSPNGKKLLSWRVQLLPFLNQHELFKQFHQDEPWDSEHNRQLLDKMPEIFASANITREQQAQGMTSYLGPIADKTLFAAKEGVTIKQITDGTSNTIMVVDANQETAVPWTKPDDLMVDLKLPFKGLSGQPGARFWGLLGDGSVRAIPETIDADDLRRLFQINDGEPIKPF